MDPCAEGGLASGLAECAWDCGRELRALREAAARSHADEANALRRHSEEVERCALRRQLDESSALQNFLMGLHGALEARLEQQRAHCSGRLDALERRINGEVDRLTCVEGGVVGEVRRAVCEVAQTLEQCADTCEAESRSVAADDEAVEAIRKAMAKVSVNLKAAAASAAQETVEEALKLLTSDISKLQKDGVEERARCDSEVQTLGSRIQAAEGSTKSAMAAVEAATRRLQEELGAVRAGEELRPRMEALEAMGKHALARLAELEAVTEATAESSRVGLGEAEAREALCLTTCASETVTRIDEARAMVESVAADTNKRLADLHVDFEDIELFAREELAEVSGCCRCAHSELERRCEAQSRELERYCEVQSREAQHASLDSFRAETDVWVARTEFSASEMDVQMREHLEGLLDSRVGECLEGLRVATTTLHDLEGAEACARRQLVDEHRAASSQADAKLRPEVSQLGRQMRELRQEVAAAALDWRTSAAESAQALSAVSAGQGRLAAEVTHLQQQGLEHEWQVQNCMKRLEYLSISGEAGLFLDSPEFTLGCLGVLRLRLYPRGVRGGDGQCGIGLHSAASTHGTGVPLRLNLSIGGLGRQAVVKYEDDGSTLWLVTSMGSVEAHITENADVAISVHVQHRPWAAVQGDGGEGREAPQRANAIAGHCRQPLLPGKPPLLAGREPSFAEEPSFADSAWLEIKCPSGDGEKRSRSFSEGRTSIRPVSLKQEESIRADDFLRVARTSGGSSTTAPKGSWMKFGDFNETSDGRRGAVSEWGVDHQRLMAIGGGCGAAEVPLRMQDPMDSDTRLCDASGVTVAGAGETLGYAAASLAALSSGSSSKGGGGGGGVLRTAAPNPFGTGERRAPSTNPFDK